MSQITKDTLIGDVLNSKADADKIIQAYFGSGCFTCPAVTHEPLHMGATLHNVDLEKMLEELNALEDGTSKSPSTDAEKGEKKSFLSWIFKGE